MKETDTPAQIMNCKHKITKPSVVQFRTNHLLEKSNSIVGYSTRLPDLKQSGIL